jgi:hypothetical protein
MAIVYRVTNALSSGSSPRYDTSEGLAMFQTVLCPDHSPQISLQVIAKLISVACKLVTLNITEMFSGSLGSDRCCYSETVSEIMII